MDLSNLSCCAGEKTLLLEMLPVVEATVGVELARYSPSNGTPGCLSQRAQTVSLVKATHTDLLHLLSHPAGACAIGQEKALKSQGQAAKREDVAMLWLGSAT